MARLELVDLTKMFPGGIRAVDQLNLEVGDHELVTLVGPSGSGKSTTLRLVCGLEAATGGRVRIGARDVTKLSPKQRDVALVFQNPALYPHLSVASNLAFGLRMRGADRSVIERQVAQAAGVLGLDTLLTRRPATLSGGQQQRVALGRALVRRPQCFLLDEPLSHLDVHLRLELREVIRRLQRELHTATLYVTHDQEEALAVGDRVAVMSAGVLQQCSTPREIYARPINRFVAGFIGAPAMNFMSGKLMHIDGTLRFRSGPLDWPLPSAWNHRLQSAIGSDVVLGFRPEAIGDRPVSVLGTALGDGLVSCEATIEAARWVGSRIDVRLALAEQSIMASLSPTAQVTLGDSRAWWLDLLQGHLFAADAAGKNLTAVD